MKVNLNIGIIILSVKKYHLVLFVLKKETEIHMLRFVYAYQEGSCMELPFRIKIPETDGRILPLKKIQNLSYLKN